MKDNVELLTEIIQTMCDLPDILHSNPVDVAFSIGAVVTHLEYLRESLRNNGNGDV
jgi:hypothetical protein